MATMAAVSMSAKASLHDMAVGDSPVLAEAEAEAAADWPIVGNGFPDGVVAPRPHPASKPASASTVRNFMVCLPSCTDSLRGAQTQGLCHAQAAVMRPFPVRSY